MPDIMHSLEIAAEPEAVYAAITEGEKLAQWWTDTNTAEAVEGSQADFVFEGGQIVFKMKIEELDHARRVVWAAVDSPVPGWPGTTITFDLAPQDGRTMLLFGHRGWPSIEGAFPNINFNWALYLQSLKDYLETGTGSPHVEPK